MQETALCYMCCNAITAAFVDCILASPDIDTLMGPDSLTFSTQLLVVPWVIEAVSFNLARPVRPHCQKGSGIYKIDTNMQKEVAFPVLSPLLDAKVLEVIILIPDSLTI